MGLFGNKKDRQDNQAQDGGKAEADRLVALPVPDLAAEILPAFGPGGPGEGGKETGAFQAAMFLMKDYKGGNTFVKPLIDPVKEGVQALTTAGLLTEKVRGIGGATVSISRLGEQALEEGNARKYLG